MSDKKFLPALQGSGTARKRRVLTPTSRVAVTCFLAREEQEAVLRFLAQHNLSMNDFLRSLVSAYVVDANILPHALRDMRELDV